MQTVLIGVGQAGGKIAAALADYDARTGFDAVLDAVAVNTAKTDLRGLPMDTVLVGQDRVKGHGVGGDNELGAAVMEADAMEVLDALDDRVTSRAEAIVVVAGLGGGTGSGGAPVLVRELKRVYDVPVYALGILPSRDEGAMYQVNAGRSLKTLASVADSVVLVANDAWQAGDESLGEAYESINRNIAQRVGLLFGAGEATEGVAESVVDTSEIINTLRGGGIAALGYAAAEAGEAADMNVNVVTSVVRKAVLTGTSLPDATTADAALVVVAGRPEQISRKGVERARSWVEEQTGSLQVRGGDLPVDSDRLAALVVLAGVERSPVVEAFLERARQAASEADEVSRERSDPKTAFENDALEDLL